MQCVLLLSGGKDSLYSLVHATANGHHPVLLASLGKPQRPAPLDDANEEMDSFLFQTVGHAALDAVASALGLPLVRAPITGTTIDHAVDYGSRLTLDGVHGDETEDLYNLLARCCRSHPQLKAVCSGAILSNYQRVRVEHVCARLGLVSLAYLWERNQEQLLDEMIRARMECILIKVAGAGLRTEHLGQTLTQMKPTLHRLHELFDLHVCGEGGEYESFTLDCPLYRSRIVVDGVSQFVSNPDRHATVAHLRLGALSLVPKTSPASPLDEVTRRDWLDTLVTIPPLLDETSLTVLEHASAGYHAYCRPQWLLSPGADLLSHYDSTTLIPAEQSITDGDLCIGNVTARARMQPSWTLEQEVLECFKQLEERLIQIGGSLLSLSHVTVYLSAATMPHYKTVNRIYATMFGTSPPTRACVGVNFTEADSKIRLKLEVEGRIESGVSTRRSLHVQSLSYWTAANIGPYSQAIVAGSRLYLAGQIPLLPRNLDLCDDGFPVQTALSLQHVTRVQASAMRDSGLKGGGRCEGGVCWLTADDDEEWARRVGAASHAWRAWLDSRDEEEQHSPLTFVQAAVLPKFAPIEWQLTFDTAQRSSQPPSFHLVTDTSAGVAASSDSGPIRFIRAFHLPTISHAQGGPRYFVGCIRGSLVSHS